MRHKTKVICASGMTLVLSAGGLTGCMDTERPDNLIRTSPIVTTMDMPLCESASGSGELDESLSEALETTDGDEFPDDNGITHPDKSDTEPKETDGNEEKADAGDSSADNQPKEDSEPQDNPDGGVKPDPSDLSALVSSELMRDNFRHGPLPADKVRYIVLHDTESGTDDAEAIASSWGSGHIAAHFVVDKAGRIVQCVPIDQIAHHAGNADDGANDRYGISAERDDEVGRTGSGDYAMNAWSIGIEIVHEHDDGAYPEAQLEAIDRLISAIDQSVGHRPDIIDHKAWAGSRKQDVSEDFPLGSYQRSRRHTD